MRSSPTKNLLAIMSFLVLVALGLYGFMFWQLTENNRKLSVLSNEIAEQNNQQISAESAHDAAIAAEPDITLLNSYVVGKGDDLVQFINYIESLGEQSGVALSIDSVGLSPEVTTVPGFQSLALSVKTEGSWKATSYFLSLLETIPYKIHIQNVTLGAISTSTRGAGPSWDSTVEFSALERS